MWQLFFEWDDYEDTIFGYRYLYRHTTDWVQLPCLPVG